MTESEARKEIIESGIKLGAGDYVDIKALEVAVKALEEVEQYRAIGTVEEFAYAKRKVHIAELATEHIDKMEKTLKDYEAIGTIERFRELTEKEELCDRNIKMFNGIACDIAKKVRANVIDEFAEAIMVKATELSEKVVFDGRLLGEALSLDCVSDMVLEIASQMKGEKEC